MLFGRRLQESKTLRMIQSTFATSPVWLKLLASRLNSALRSPPMCIAATGRYAGGGSLSLLPLSKTQHSVPQGSMLRI